VTRDGGWTCAQTKLTHPSLRVRSYTPRKLRSRLVTKLQQMGPDIKMVVPDNNLINGKRAMLERLVYVKDDVFGFVEPTDPGCVIVNGALSKFKKELRKHLFTVPPYSREQFLSRYAARRREVYSKALDSIDSKAVDKKDAWVKFFVKAENTNITAKPDAVPRGISPRGPRYCSALGLFIGPMERPIYQAIAEVFGQATVMKGMNASTQGTKVSQYWHSFKKPVAVGLDAKRFDQHISRSVLEWEHSVYRYCNRDKELKRLLDMQLSNRINANFDDGGLSIVVKGKRMSGDMNTGLGNCLVMCAMVYSYCDYAGLVKYKLINNGDDCVVIMEQEDLWRMNHVQLYFGRLGFRMEVEPPVYQLEQLKFCQTHPIRTPEGWVMVRDHFVSRAKDVSTFRVFNEKEFRAWCHSVGTGGLCLTGGVPVMDEFYRAILKAGVKGRWTEEKNGMWFMKRGMDRTQCVISPVARYSYWLAFGITPSHQAIIEEYYRGFTVQWHEREGKSSLPNGDGKMFLPIPLWDGMGLSN
jgi:hypothetical protein